jgi:osmotically inducible protein OsmC
MPTRTARTGWTGTLEQGVGQVELTSSKLGTYEVSFPHRAADSADGYTSPEELIAAAHSACYAMALSGEIARAGGVPQALDATQFAEAAAVAKAGCPVSKALTGVEITLDAALEE